ncbi:MAG: acetate--CoA ligase family protein [Paracoccaceae bacterium]|nr:acetate--CoA ligase family protein [Paracoccaceae bacterium]
MRDLSRLLHPKSIAVFGASWAENVIRECARIGFQGDVWPVHPTRETVGGHRAFRSVAELPSAPDAAFVGINRHATVEVVEELSARGCGGVVSFASGFSEVGEPGLQAELVRRADGMPLLGPNCYGLINCLDGAIIWPDPPGCVRAETGVAILSQSSNIAISLTMQRRGLPVAYIACVGNAAQIGMAELANALVRDARVTALGVYMEGVGDAAAFAEVVEQARGAGKGVVVLKGGRTEKGREAAASHTAALAGGGVASSAYLKQIGAAEVRTIPELAETLKIFHGHGPLTARRFVSVSCSGGEAGLMADALADTGLNFPPLPEPAQAGLAEVLGPRVPLANPLDYHTYIWGDRPKLSAAFTASLTGFDAGLFVFDPPRADRVETESYEPAIAALADAAASGKPVFAVASLPETIDEALAERLAGSGVVPLLGIETALAAIGAASAESPSGGWRPWAVAPEAASELLDEAAAKALLGEAGLTVPRGVAGASLADLDPLGLTPPFALKGLGFAHKSEAGAVRLGVTDAGSEPPMAGAAGYLLEEMVGGVVAEVLVGLRRDPVYGATLTVGLGGVEAELLADTVTLILPVTREQVEAAFRSLRLWPLLDGFRGRPKAAVGAAIDAIECLQGMMAADPDLLEIEINPLMLTANGAVAADALIRRNVT